MLCVCVVCWVGLCGALCVVCCVLRASLCVCNLYTALADAHGVCVCVLCCVFFCLMCHVCGLWVLFFMLYDLRATQHRANEQCVCIVC